MRAFLIVLLVCIQFLAFGQCNVTTTINWVNGTTPACQANNTLQIGSTGNVTFDSNGDTYGTENVSVIYVSGILTLDGNVSIYSDIVIQNGGRVNVNGQVTLYGDVDIQSGGTMEINGKMSFTVSSGPCDVRGSVQPGGSLLMNGGSSEKLTICGVEIFRGGTSGGCNAFPAGGPPYCAGNPPFSGGSITPQNGNPLSITPTGVLPIKLLYFTAELKDEFVLLNWATSKEENFDHVELERASSNKNFIKIAEVQGAGYNTETLHKYSWLDTNPFAGQNYYRLKAVDLDGTFEYFKIATVESASENRRFSVFPNPAKGNFVNYALNFDNSGNGKIVVMDNMGNVLQQTLVSSIEGKLDFEEITPGLYFVQYVSDDFRQIVRVTIR